LHLTGAKPGLTIPPVPVKPKRKRSTAPKAFEGLTHKPHCVLCERETTHPNPPAPVPPDPMSPTNRRPRTVDTSMHFCPHRSCPCSLRLNTPGSPCHGIHEGPLWHATVVSPLHAIERSCRRQEEEAW